MGQEEKNKAKEEEKEVEKSYHNFIFPFIWKNSEDSEGKKVDFSKIVKNFSESEIWIDDDLQNYQEIDVSESSISRSKYSIYQYFQPAVREAVFGRKKKQNDGKVNGVPQKDVVQNFSFAPVSLAETASYVIKKGSSTYSLDLLKVKLRLYNTGVGLLCFICENNNCEHFADIKNINDYGRRISLPYIPTQDPDENFICADEIAVSWKKDENDKGIKLSEDFSKYIHTVNTTESKVDYHRIADFILKILNYETVNRRNRYHFTTNEMNETGESIFIQPAMDDRMFVMCAVNGKIKELIPSTEKSVTISDYIKQIEAQDSIEDSEAIKKMEESLYEFMFCDREDWCSCKSSIMRKNLIREHMYTRWAEYGTIYSIAAQEFALVCYKEQHVFDAFLNIYYEMICLVLVQRASLRVFQNEASDLSAHVEDEGRVVNKKQRQRIADLQEKLIAFQNQINHYEVSSQEQAIELYDMMREVFLVNKHTSLLQEQLDGLYNVVNIRQSDVFSSMAGKLAVIAILIALPSFINDFDSIPCSWKEGFVDYSDLILGVKVILGCAIAWVIYKLRNK